MLGLSKNAMTLRRQRIEDDLERKKNLLPKYRDLEFLDTELHFNNDKISANNPPFTHSSPKKTTKITESGSMIMIENISDEKSNEVHHVSHIHEPGTLPSSGETVAKIYWVESKALAPYYFQMFRSFTTITGAAGRTRHGWCHLNEYFTVMVDCIQKRRRHA